MEVEEEFVVGEHDITTAELWRWHDGKRTIIYKVPRNPDVRDICVAITHEWLHIAMRKCGIDKNYETVVEILARISVEG